MYPPIPPKRPELEILRPDYTTCYPDIPLAQNPVHAGFISPAEDYKVEPLDLLKRMVKNPASTFYVRVIGDCMIGEGIHEGDILVVDKSIVPTSGCLAVCEIDQEFCLRRVKFEQDHAVLYAANPNYDPIIGNESNGFRVWGVVRHVDKEIRNINL